MKSNSKALGKSEEEEEQNEEMRSQTRNRCKRLGENSPSTLNSPACGMVQIDDLEFGKIYLFNATPWDNRSPASTFLFLLQKMHEQLY
jgi:hypothetical protein